MGTWRSRHLDVMSRSTDQLKGTIISFQSLQTSFRSFPNTQESILCYSMYVLQLTNLYTLYDTLIPYAYVLAGTVSCSASTYSQCSKFQRNFAKFADFGPLRIFENFENNNLNIFKSIFKNNLKINFGRNSHFSAMSEIFCQTKLKTLHTVHKVSLQ